MLVPYKLKVVEHFISDVISCSGSSQAKCLEETQLSKINDYFKNHFSLC